MTCAPILKEVEVDLHRKRDSRQMGITLPELQASVASLVPAVRTGDLLFLSGSGPAHGSDGKVTLGKLGRELNVELGYESARLVGLNLIARLKAELGDLGRVKRVVKLLCMVNSVPDFTEQPGRGQRLLGPAGRGLRGARAPCPLGGRDE